MALEWLSRVGISLETDASRIAVRAGARPVGWDPGVQTGSLIYRLPADPMERASLFAREQRIRVAEGEVAVVMRDGVLQGVMEPGVYRTEKARLLGAIDVVWIKTGPRLVRWGAGNVLSTDGIQVGANGTLTVAVVDGAAFNAQLVQGALTLPDTELQRMLLPGIQGVVRSLLAKAEAVQLLGERDLFVGAIATGLGEHLTALGLGLRGFEVADFILPPEFREAVASRALATARSRGELVQAQTDAQKRVLAAQAEAGAMLLAGDARAKVFQQMQAVGIDPMSLEAMDALKAFAETPTGGVLGTDPAKAGLFGSIAAAALGANAAQQAAAAQPPFPGAGLQVGSGLGIPGPVPPQAPVPPGAAGPPQVPAADPPQSPAAGPPRVPAAGPPQSPAAGPGAALPTEVNALPAQPGTPGAAGANGAAPPPGPADASAAVAGPVAGAVPAGGPTAAPAPDGETRAGLERQLDGLTERLAAGELSEALYTKLASRIEARLAALGHG